MPANNRDRLITHPLFARIANTEQLLRFMESHVFAVWDFMSLLKTLQRQLTVTSVPWLPPQNRMAARLINEIVLGEESDQIGGEYISHFELYIDAMAEAGANTNPIAAFISVLSEGGDLESAFQHAEAPEHVRRFVRSTMDFCGKQPHEVAAAFLYGREDIIPDMFERVLKDVALVEQPRFAKLKLYMNRHIEVDGGSHGPMAKQLMESLCGKNSHKQTQAQQVAEAALEARYRLWDGVLSSLD